MFVVVEMVLMLLGDWILGFLHRDVLDCAFDDDWIGLDILIHYDGFGVMTSTITLNLNLIINTSQIMQKVFRSLASIINFPERHLNPM